MFVKKFPILEKYFVTMQHSNSPLNVSQNDPAACHMMPLKGLRVIFVSLLFQSSMESTVERLFILSVIRFFRGGAFDFSRYI